MKARRTKRTLLLWISLVAILTACTYTSHFAPEYRQSFELIEDVVAYPCETFTGALSVWSGPEHVLCAGMGHVAGQTGTMFTKGTSVKVTKLYSIAAVDAFYDSCRVSMQETPKGMLRSFTAIGLFFRSS